MRMIIASMTLLCLAGSAVSQTPPAPGGPPPRVLKQSLAPRPDPLTPWVAPNRPHWKLSEITARHARQMRWSQVVVQDAHFTGTFIQMAPGERTRRLFYPDAEMFWVVQSGRMRVHIDGLAPFVAEKSAVVQVPARTPFHVETLGDAPVLRFEVVHTGLPPIYDDGEMPDAPPGHTQVRIAYAAPIAPPKLDPAQIHINFDRDIVQGGGRAGRFLKAGSFIRGMSIPTPPRSDLGHWHTETAEFYFIMEGRLDFQLEGVDPFIVEPGDVVYVPVGRYHRNNFTGGGMATRLAIFPAGNINNLDPENPSRQAP